MRREGGTAADRRQLRRHRHGRVARRHRQHRLDRRLRRPDRAGRLCRSQ